MRNTAASNELIVWGDPPRQGGPALVWRVDEAVRRRLPPPSGHGCTAHARRTADRHTLASHDASGGSGRRTRRAVDTARASRAGGLVATELLDVCHR